MRTRDRSQRRQAVQWRIPTCSERDPLPASSACHSKRLITAISYGKDDLVEALCVASESTAKEPRDRKVHLFVHRVRSWRQKVALVEEVLAILDDRDVFIYPIERRVAYAAHPLTPWSPLHFRLLFLWENILRVLFEYTSQRRETLAA
jgi:hypothetical protein